MLSNNIDEEILTTASLLYEQYLLPQKNSNNPTVFLLFPSPLHDLIEQLILMFSHQFSVETISVKPVARLEGQVRRATTLSTAIQPNRAAQGMSSKSASQSQRRPDAESCPWTLNQQLAARDFTGIWFEQS